MRIKMRATVFVLAIVTIVILLLLVGRKPRNPLPVLGNVGAETQEISARLLSLIDESIGTSPTEKILIGYRRENEVLVLTTNRTMVSKAICMNPNSKEMLEYVQIARAESSGIGISNDVVPTIEVQDEWVIVIFPDPESEKWIDGPPCPGASEYYAIVTIDIKTKTVLDVLTER
jgi:hypothetical protein